jgi:hypothetical protein
MMVIQSGALHTAGGLLPVVRYVRGMTAAAMAALALLEATLESCDMHLLRHVRTLLMNTRRARHTHVRPCVCWF